MDIAFITTGYFPIPPVRGGAVENLVYSLITQNELHGKHHFTVYSSYDLVAEKIAANYVNTRFEYIKTPRLLESIDKILFFFISNILKKEKTLSFRYIAQRIYYEFIVSKKITPNAFDKIIVENTPASFLPIKWNKNKKNYEDKIVYHLHNEIGYSFGCDTQIKQATLVIGISNFINNKFKERYPEYTGKFEVLRNCNTHINQKKNFDKNIIRTKLGISDKTFLVVFAGRLSHEKGVLELIKAFKGCNIENSQLLIVGGTYYNTDIISSYEKLLHQETKDIRKQVVFTGYVAREMIDTFYTCADVVVLPSIWEEPAGLTIIEAMSSGTPVITTDSGGILEYVGNDNCIVLERNEKIINSISDSIRYVYNNKEKCDQMGKNAKNYVKAYNACNYYTEFCKIMEQR